MIWPYLRLNRSKLISKSKYQDSFYLLYCLLDLEQHLLLLGLLEPIVKIHEIKLRIVIPECRLDLYYLQTIEH